MQYSHPTPFPKDFFWGASTSAYQVEGGWDADGKGPSIVDARTHFPDGTSDYKVASDHYHRFEEDVALFAELAYQFGPYLGVSAAVFLLHARFEVHLECLGFHRVGSFHGKFTRTAPFRRGRF